MCFSDYLNERFDNNASVLELKSTISDLEERNSELFVELYEVITFFQDAIKYARTNVELLTRIKEYFRTYHELSDVDIANMFKLLFNVHYTRMIDCEFFEIDEDAETITDRLDHTVKYFPFKLAIIQLEFDEVNVSMVCDWVYSVITADPPKLLERMVDEQLITGYAGSVAVKIKELQAQAEALGFTLTKVV